MVSAGAGQVSPAKSESAGASGFEAAQAVAGKNPKASRAGFFGRMLDGLVSDKAEASAAGTDSGRSSRTRAASERSDAGKKPRVTAAADETESGNAETRLSRRKRPMNAGDRDSEQAALAAILSSERKSGPSVLDLRAQSGAGTGGVQEGELLKNGGSKPRASRAQAGKSSDRASEEPETTGQVPVKRRSSTANGAEAGETQQRPEKSSEARRNPRKFSVTDLRPAGESASSDSFAAGNAGNAASAASGKDATLPTGMAATASGSPTGSTRNGTETEATTESRFSKLLDDLKSDTNNRIVRQTAVILKTDTTGELRLTLRPESLGRVRIQVEVKDNRIEGKIFVENKEVKDVFERNMADLTQAFREDGFEVGNFDVSVGYGQQSGNPRSDGQGAGETAYYVTEASETATAVGSLAGRSIDAYAFGSERLVNLFV